MSVPLYLVDGRTAEGVNVPLRVGDDGQMNGSGGTPVTETGPLPARLFCGRTAGGVNTPLAMDTDGNLLFSET